MILDLLPLDVATMGMPVIVCSAAHGELTAQAERIAQRRARVLLKPFDIDELVSLVHECIGPPSD